MVGNNPAARPRRPTTALTDLAAVGLLALLTIGFFWRVVFAGEWMPAGGGDLASFLYPTYKFVAQVLKAGTIPFWNPYLWAGTPLAADIQSSIFYPLNLVYFWLSPEVTYRGLMAMAIFHIWLAGVGMYLCLKYAFLEKTGTAENNNHWPITLPSLLGAVAFMFSDFFIVHFGNLNLIAQAAWLPFVVLFFHRSLARRRLEPALWAGIFLAVCATAGHIQPLVFVVFVLTVDAGYWLVAGLLERRSEPAGDRRAVVRPLLSLFLTLAIGVGLAACVLLPGYQMTQYTPRAEMGFQQASQYSLAPAQLVGLVIPGFFGRDPALHWGVWDRVEVGYAGVFTLLLAGLALLQRRCRQTTFLAVLTALSLAIALGGYTIVFGWFYQAVPALSGIRAPARYIFVFDFGLAALAAFGLHRLMRDDEKNKALLAGVLRWAPWVLGAIVFFLLPLFFYAVILSQDKDAVIFARASAAANGAVFFAGLLLAGFLLLWARQRHRLSGTLLGILALALVFFDLASLGSNVDVGQDDPTRGFDHPAIVAFLKTDVDLYRIDSRTGIWHLWQPDTSLLNQIFDVAGVVNPLTLADYQRFLDSLPDRTTPLYDFLNAKYVIAAKDVVLDWEKFAPVFDEDPALNVYLNRRSLPRVQMVYDVVAAPSHEAAFEALQAPSFDPATSVVLESAARSEAPPAASIPATIGFDDYEINRLVLTVDNPQEAPGYLVLSEVWHPGWQATVDGLAAPILRANYAFRAVAIPPGRHQVTMIYRPPGWPAGIAVTAATAVIVLLLGVAFFLRRRIR